MYHSRHRHYQASVALYELPENQILSEDSRDGATVADPMLWDRSLSSALHIDGQPDAEYEKSGLAVVVSVPPDCDYWLDNNKLVIIKAGRTCPQCHSLLFREDGIESCMSCMMIWEVTE